MSKKVRNLSQYRLEKKVTDVVLVSLLLALKNFRHHSVVDVLVLLLTLNKFRISFWCGIILVFLLLTLKKQL